MTTSNAPAPLDALSGLTTHQLETELLGLAGHIAAAQCRFLLLLAEFDDRTAGPGQGCGPARTGCPGGSG